MIEEGTAAASVVAEIKQREARLSAIQLELQMCLIEQPSQSDLRRLKDAFRGRLERFHELLLSDVALARQALRKLIPGRIVFRPTERYGARGYALSWSLVTSALMGGNIELASPRGFEPRLSP